MTSVFGRLEGCEQRVELMPAALAHMREYRQTSQKATEAGGQLFGTIRPELIQVSKATGPYCADERSRYRYRSNPSAAQRAIRKQSQAGLLYLGEWHTHAEDHTDASGLDYEAMRLLLATSDLNSNTLLMLIVGRLLTIDGLALWTVASNREYRWFLEQLSVT